MAKKLLIVRHAKSDWGKLTLQDFDRPLNERGLANAPEMAQRLLKNNNIPQKIVSSPALRAITTCKLIAQALGITEENIQLNSRIYEAHYQDLLAIVNNL